ncbi:MAG: hypothetical protein ABIN91_02390 [Mucilaginibacter sp.]|uniref:hypothetical protein n=1 Tax=Mucilaginibacter sp. TaxID=1882438 RepID=UPI00326483C7
MRHLSVIVLLFICLAAYGQADATTLRDDQKQQQDRKDQKMERRGGKGNKSPDGLNRIRLIRTAYITKRLELTPAQAEKFWPLYNKYQEEMAAVQKQIRQNNSPSQTNGKDQVLNELALDEKKTNIKKFYTNEFLKILPFEKVSLIYKSEKDFMDEVIKKMREQKSEANN